jgi:hypothetical protein
MRSLIRLTILGLAGYGAKALYDRFGSSTQSGVAGKDPFAGPVRQQPQQPTTSASSHAPGRVDPNSPAAQSDDALAVAMATPPKLS